MVERLQKYAKLAIQKGVNLQKGQSLMINSSVDAMEMTRVCVEEAYLAGAKEVVVFYRDEYVSKSHFMHQQEDTLTRVREWQVDSKLDYFKEGACILHIISEVPGILKDVDASKISKQRLAFAKAGKEIQQYTMKNKTQWSIVAVSNTEWAKLVFPKDEHAKEKLMDCIYKAVHVESNNDPIKEWEQLNQSFEGRKNILNAYDFEALRFVNSLGTNVTIELVEHHIWAGGSEETIDGIEFNPNMPTEEIFTMPKKTGVNGNIVASKPLDYNGTLITNFSLTFKDGKVVSFDAGEGKEALESLIHFDEGSCYLGEVALVPFDSPISKSGILFYNTLFDENASCHVALGDAYPMNVVGGTDMSEEELQKAGANHSMTHVDFMFGSEDMSIIGICKDGSEIPVFVKGDFVF